MKHHFSLIDRLGTILGMSLLASAAAMPTANADTLGGGTVALPAVAPAPAYNVGISNLVCVENWEFGSTGTIANQAQMNTNFQYHDRYGTWANAWQYGASTLAPDAANALYSQPIEGVDSSAPVRSFTSNSLKTYLVPLNGATTVDPNKRNAGCGSFIAQWTLPCAGSFLGQDIVWETKVRYVTPPYFWFALWNVGARYGGDASGTQGAEFDGVETFGYDNRPQGGDTNFDGHKWHSNMVAHPSSDPYDANHGYDGDWANGMAAGGITSFDATQYHTWQMVFKHDDTYAVYCDGHLVQSGSNYYWTVGHLNTGTPIDYGFIFDASWGNTSPGLESVNHTLPASALAGTYYEFNYSRVYLTNVATPIATPTGLTQSVNNNQVTLRWNPVSGATRYYIYRAGDGQNQGFKEIDSSPTNSYTDTFPFQARYWTYYVVAVNNNGGGASLPSNQVSAEYINIPNNSFETPAQNGGYTTNPAGASWAFTNTGSNISGIVAGGNSTWGVPAAPDGAQVAFIQNTGSITTPVLWDWLGGVNYVVTGSAALRAGSSGPQTVNVLLDNTQIGSFTISNTSFTPFTIGPFVPSWAGHSVSFVGTVTSGLSTVFLDNIQVHCKPDVAPLVVPIHHRIGIKSSVSGYYVSADLSGGAFQNYLRGSFATRVQGWEMFDVFDAGNGTIALKSEATGKFVTVDMNQSSRVLRCDWATGIGTWEPFQWVDQGNGVFALKSAIDGLYVSCDMNNSQVLEAQWATSVGSWEQFTWTDQGTF